MIYNRDIEFFPNCIYKFAACGLQYLAIFNYKGALLSYYNLEIENPKVEIFLYLNYY